MDSFHHALAACSQHQGEEMPGVATRGDMPEIKQGPGFADAGSVVDGGDVNGQAEITRRPLRPDLSPALKTATNERPQHGYQPKCATARAFGSAFNTAGTG